MSGEEWKPIVGYEGLYEISSFGRLRSFSRKVNRAHNGSYVIPERILSAHDSTRGGVQITLSSERKLCSTTLKKLVAQAFLPNPAHCRYLIQIDGNKRNCRVDNLVWRADVTVRNSEGKRQRVPRKIFFPLSDLRSSVVDVVQAYAADKKMEPARVWDSLRRSKWKRLTGEKS